MTKILVVSFGGQIIHRPSRSRSASRPGTSHNPHGLACSLPENNLSGQLHQSLTVLASSKNQRRPWKTPPPLSTPSHIHIPGAPAPALKSPATARLPEFSTVPPTPPIVLDGAPCDGVLDVGDQFLPNESWIAVVCGVSDSKEWRSRSRTPNASDVMNSVVTLDAGNGNEEDDFPERFYIAPKDVYMPDLMAVGDVLLGKLGYGTVSECVESCTPFVYVSRPLFIEEHGLQLLLDSEGVGVEMEHEEYEAGSWAVKVAEAWKQGGYAKVERRSGLRVVDRQSQGRAMAEFVVDWVGEWNRLVSIMKSDSTNM
ncbi:hypothetical protein EWM64_g1599 [Hericium alpestre]|uniref:Uncharacterized protein n=1 Tax=Hericium alpestre TaxID=135208 RepID=A0A4Z0A7E0_9AGAM|nr:hypothetical protein EWM64_g1599 [Hericium alpestre]